MPFHRFSRPFAAALVGALFFQGAVFAHARETAFWSDRRKTFRRFKNPTPVISLQTGSWAALPRVPVESFSSPSSLRRFEGLRELEAKICAEILRALPYARGSIRRVVPPSGPSERPSPVVVLIQDVHQNAEAQQNIAAGLTSLLRSTERGSADSKGRSTAPDSVDHRISLVTLEGGFGPLDFSRFRSLPRRDFLADVADFLFRENNISGPVRALLSSADHGPPVFGVDDKNLYDENVEAYKSSRPFLRGANARWSEEWEALCREKAEVFSPALFEFDARVRDHHRGAFPLGDYARLLTAGARAAAADVEGFVAALDLEKKMNFQQVEEERRVLLQSLVRNLFKAAADAFVKSALAYQSGSISHGDFYEGLRAACDKAGVRLESFPDVERYIRYVLLADSIDAEKLRDGLLLLENETYDRMALRPEEKELVRRSRRLSLERGLLDFSLTPPEWEEYKSIRDREGRRGAGYPLKFFEDFYRKAEARNGAMAENLLRALRQSARGSSPVAVLVAGGFHAPGLSRLLSEKGAAVVNFVPRMTRADDSAAGAYLGVFSQDKTPLEKLFAGEKLFLAKTPWGPPQAGKVSGLYASHMARVGEAPRDIEEAVRDAAGGNVRVDVRTRTPTETVLDFRDEDSPSGAARLTARFSGGKLEGYESTARRLAFSLGETAVREIVFCVLRAAGVEEAGLIRAALFVALPALRHGREGKFSLGSFRPVVSRILVAGFSPEIFFPYPRPAWEIVLPWIAAVLQALPWMAAQRPALMSVGEIPKGFHLWDRFRDALKRRRSRAPRNDFQWSSFFLSERLSTEMESPAASPLFIRLVSPPSLYGYSRGLMEGFETLGGLGVKAVSVVQKSDEAPAALAPRVLSEQGSVPAVNVVQWHGIEEEFKRGAPVLEHYAGPSVVLLHRPQEILARYGRKKTVEILSSASAVVLLGGAFLTEFQRLLPGKTVASIPHGVLKIWDGPEKDFTRTDSPVIVGGLTAWGAMRDVDDVLEVVEAVGGREPALRPRLVGFLGGTFDVAARARLKSLIDVGRGRLLSNREIMSARENGAFDDEASFRRWILHFSEGKVLIRGSLENEDVVPEVPMDDPRLDSWLQGLVDFKIDWTWDRTPDGGRVVKTEEVSGSLHQIGPNVPLVLRSESMAGVMADEGLNIVLVPVSAEGGPDLGRAAEDLLALVRDPERWRGVVGKNNETARRHGMVIPAYGLSRLSRAAMSAPKAPENPVKDFLRRIRRGGRGARILGPAAIYDRMRISLVEATFRCGTILFPRRSESLLQWRESAARPAFERYAALRGLDAFGNPLFRDGKLNVIHLNGLIQAALKDIGFPPENFRLSGSAVVLADDDGFLDLRLARDFDIEPIGHGVEFPRDREAEFFDALSKMLEPHAADIEMDKENGPNGHFLLSRHFSKGAMSIGFIPPPLGLSRKRGAADALNKVMDHPVTLKFKTLVRFLAVLRLYGDDERRNRFWEPLTQILADNAGRDREDTAEIDGNIRQDFMESFLEMRDLRFPQIMWDNFPRRWEAMYTPLLHWDGTPRTNVQGPPYVQGRPYTAYTYFLEHEYARTSVYKKIFLAVGWALALSLIPGAAWGAESGGGETGFSWIDAMCFLGVGIRPFRGFLWSPDRPGTGTPDQAEAEPLSPPEFSGFPPAAPPYDGRPLTDEELAAYRRKIGDRLKSIQRALKLSNGYLSEAIGYAQKGANILFRVTTLHQGAGLLVWIRLSHVLKIPLWVLLHPGELEIEDVLNTRGSAPDAPEISLESLRYFIENNALVRKMTLTDLSRRIGLSDRSDLETFRTPSSRPGPKNKAGPSLDFFYGLWRAVQGDLRQAGNIRIEGSPQRARYPLIRPDYLTAEEKQVRDALLGGSPEPGRHAFLDTLERLEKTQSVPFSERLSGAQLAAALRLYLVGGNAAEGLSLKAIGRALRPERPFSKQAVDKMIKRALAVLAAPVLLDWWESFDDFPVRVREAAGRAGFNDEAFRRRNGKMSERTSVNSLARAAEVLNRSPGGLLIGVEPPAGLARPNTFVEGLKAALDGKGWSAAGLAERSAHPKLLVEAYVDGRSVPSVGVLLRLAAALDVPPDRLVPIAPSGPKGRIPIPKEKKTAATRAEELYSALSKVSEEVSKGVQNLFFGSIFLAAAASMVLLEPSTVIFGGAGAFAFAGIVPFEISPSAYYWRGAGLAAMFTFAAFRRRAAAKETFRGEALLSRRQSARALAAILWNADGSMDAGHRADLLQNAIGSPVRLGLRTAGVPTAEALMASWIFYEGDDDFWSDVRTEGKGALVRGLQDVSRTLMVLVGVADSISSAGNKIPVTAALVRNSADAAHLFSLLPALDERGILQVFLAPENGRAEESLKRQVRLLVADHAEVEFVRPQNYGSDIRLSPFHHGASALLRRRRLRPEDVSFLLALPEGRRVYEGIPENSFLFNSRVLLLGSGLPAPISLLKLKAIDGLARAIVEKMA